MQDKFEAFIDGKKYREYDSMPQAICSLSYSGAASHADAVAIKRKKPEPEKKRAG
jgi:hypothetical protein